MSFLFDNLRINHTPLNQCEMVLECNSRFYRLYVIKGNNMFHAIAVEFHSCSESDKDIWKSSDIEVGELFRVTAYFDGVRHLEFNRFENDMEGYIYYPNMEGLCEMLLKVREIEKEICRDCDD